MISAAVILSALTATAALATEGADYAPIYLDKTAITLDAGYMMDIDNLSVDHLTGGSISMSYIFNRTDKSAHSIGLTFGYFEGDDDAAMHKETDGGTTDYTERLYTRDITETLSQEILPVIISYKYQRNITDSISCYAGARAGVYISKTEVSRRDVWSHYQKKYDGTHTSIAKADDDCTNSCTRVAPTLGIELGVQYQFAKNWSWHLSGSIDASFNMIRQKSLSETSFEAANKLITTNPETCKGTAVSATIRTGFSYQF